MRSPRGADDFCREKRKDHLGDNQEVALTEVGRTFFLFFLTESPGDTSTFLQLSRPFFRGGSIIRGGGGTFQRILR